jgi:hypothetical protein
MRQEYDGIRTEYAEQSRDCDSSNSGYEETSNGRERHECSLKFGHVEEESAKAVSKLTGKSGIVLLTESSSAPAVKARIKDRFSSGL